MNILLLQLDGKLPNIALMRLAHHHKAHGDHVTLRKIGNLKYAPQVDMLEQWDLVYGSLIFERSRPLATQLQAAYPDMILGGTGWDVMSSLEQHGIMTIEQDYSVYDDPEGKRPPDLRSIGFTQRGCRLRCSFCVVPRKEGAIREEQTIADIWRGHPYPWEVLLLDNDFFGQPHWQDRIDELQAGHFKVSFNQGINARMLTDETAAAIASVDYRDDSMKSKRLYTAWDNRRDHDRLFRGLESLKQHGVKPENVMVYILIGYGEFSDDDEEWDDRRAKLRAFGCVPYPMPFIRNEKTIGFCRYTAGAYDKRVKWADWKAAGYDPYRVNLPAFIEKQPHHQEDINFDREEAVCS